MASATPGFLRMCWLGECQFGESRRYGRVADPRSVFILKIWCATFAFGAGAA